MAKSPDLYQPCIVCNGTGVSPSDLLNKDGVCIICQGAKYTPLGLNKAQVDAALRKAAEYDKFMAEFANDGSSERPTIAGMPLKYEHRAEAEAPFLPIETPARLSDEDAAQFRRHLEASSLEFVPYRGNRGRFPLAGDGDDIDSDSDSELDGQGDSIESTGWLRSDYNAGIEGDND